MASLCIGSLLAGVAATFFLPVTILFLATLVTAVVGSLLSIARGAELLQVGYVSLICIVLVQIGYGMGLVSLSLNPHLRKLQNRNLFASMLRALVSGKRTL
jgi:hypothetical protein